MRQIKQYKNRFIGRRIRNSLMLLVALAAIALLVSMQNQNLGRGDFSSGYILLGSLFFLAAFNLRKKLTFVPQIGSGAFWMQLHIYVGLGTLAIFGMHIGWTVPQGALEMFLAALYLFVAGSGIYGLYITRAIPKKLTQTRSEPIFESIPRLRRRIAMEAKQIVEHNFANSNVLDSFFRKHLQPFFEQRRKLAYLISPSAREARQLVSEIQKCERYLSDDDRQHSRQLLQLVRERDDLDYHFAMQGRLKCWLIAHVACTYSLLIVGVLHGIMAHAFAGGLR